MEGTDTDRPANWSVLDASDVLARNPWLHLQLPRVSGETDASAIRDAFPADIPLDIQLILFASGLRESATPYRETLLIDVRSRRSKMWRNR
eukprot:5173455-Prymnesium_polylepis.1